MDTLATSQTARMAESEARINFAFRNYGQKLLSFIKKRVSRLEDAEDILQDVFYQFTNGWIDTVEEDQKWLFRVARNKVIDFHRKKKEESLSEQSFKGKGDEESPLFLEDILPDAGPLPDEAYSLSMIPEMLEMGLEQLPAEQREVFIWHEVEGRTFKEMSELTGLSINTLLSRKRYAITFLRDYLRDIYEDFND